MDERGYLRIVGRLKNLIISGGFNIVPSEVESVLLQHPVVSQAEVVGVPDYRLGEAVMAFVQLKPAASCSQEEMIEFCAGKVANYKVPKYVRFVEEFPVTAYGKVQKFKLRDMAMRSLGLGLQVPD
jgi:fatty-acyl-CoA synthase